MQSTYNSLFLVTLIALVSPWLSTRLLKGLIPAVVLEIVMGIVVGPSVLHIAVSTNYIDFLANFGFSYLMFLSGLELDFALIFKKTETTGRQPWIRGLAFFIVTLLISTMVAFVLYAVGWIKNPLIVGLVLSTTSTGILMPALKEKGWLYDPLGQQLLVFGLLADLITLFGITGYVAFHTSGNGFSLLLIMVLLLFFVILYRFLRIVAKRSPFSLLENASSEIGLRGAFALILSFLAFSETLGTEVIVGAFLAGAIISLLSERHSALIGKLNSIGYGFLLPIFFVNAGIKFNIQALDSRPTYWLMLLVLLITMFVNKVIPSIYFLRYFAMPKRIAGGMLLSARLSLIIAASQIAAEIGAISAATANGMLLLAVLSCLVAPAAFNRIMQPFLPKGKNLEKAGVLTLNAKMLPENWIVDAVEVQARSMDGKPLRVLGLPQDVLIVSILRNDEPIIPRGHTRLALFDVVQLMGHPDGMFEIRQRLQGK